MLYILLLLSLCNLAALLLNTILLLTIGNFLVRMAAAVTDTRNTADSTNQIVENAHVRKAPPPNPESGLIDL